MINEKRVECEVLGVCDGRLGCAKLGSMRFRVEPAGIGENKS